MRERDIYRHLDKQREIEREGQRESKFKKLRGEKETKRETDTHTHRLRKRDRHIDGQREIERERGRERKDKNE